MPVRAFTREQAYLLPPSLDDWVPDDHPVRFVASFVDELTRDWWAQMGIDCAGEVQGAPAYAPPLVLSVWLAGFMAGIRSSRKLEAACRDQISFRWLTGNQLPDHNTLWRFYQRHRQGMRALLRRSVAVAWQAGLVDLALLAVDGTKVAADASRDRTYDGETLTQLLAQTEQAIAELEAANLAADAETTARIPQELARTQELQDRIRAALATVEAEAGPSQANVTDPDAYLHKARHGYVAGYNAQAAAVRLRLDSASRDSLLITAVAVTTDRDDHRQLVPLVDASTTMLGQAPAVVAADGGYHSGQTLAACAARAQAVVMPETQSAAATANPYHVQHFTYDADTDTYTCPHGQLLTRRTTRQKARRPPVRIYRGDAAVCRACPAFGTCTTNARQGRSLEVTAEQTSLARHRAWMQTAEAQHLSAQRKTMIEPIFGILKEQQNVRRFLVRGWRNVAAEWNLLATAFNLRALARAWQCGALVMGTTGPPDRPSDAPEPGEHTHPSHGGLRARIHRAIPSLPSRAPALTSPF